MSNYNILMLAVVHDGMAIPLLLWILDKQGDSKSERDGVIHSEVHSENLEGLKRKVEGMMADR